MLLSWIWNEGGGQDDDCLEKKENQSAEKELKRERRGKNYIKEKRKNASLRDMNPKILKKKKHDKSLVSPLITPFLHAFSFSFPNAAGNN